MAELADALVLGTSGYPCRFDPCYSHHSAVTAPDTGAATAVFFYCHNLNKCRSHGAYSMAFLFQ